MVLALAGGRTQDRALSLVVDPDRDHRGDRGDPAGLADLVERRVEPDVGVLALDRAVRKAVTSSSSDLQIRETSEREIPSIPSALTRSSTLRVDTPFT